MRDIIADIRFAWRQLRRSPGFAVAAVVTLALGVGANTLAFSLLEGTLNPRVPFPHADRLSLLDIVRTSADGSSERTLWSWPQVRWLRGQATPFQDVAAYSSSGANLSGSGDAERVQLEVVTASYFPVLGVTAATGRTFLGEEDREPGTHPVAVIGDALWRRRFGSVPDLVGRTIRLNGIPLQVVGIMPPGFTGVSGNADVFIPEMMAPTVVFARQLTTGDQFHHLVVRLRPGWSTLGGDPVLASLGERLRREVPDAEGVEGATEFRIDGRSLASAGADPVRRRSAVLLFGAVWLVLAAASINLAVLQLSRSHVRARELAVRAALGAGSRRLRRQLLVEWGVMAAIGGAGGVLVAWGGASAIARIAPAVLPSPDNAYAEVANFASIPLNGGVLLFALAVAALTGLLVNIVPLHRLTRRDLASDLRGTAAGGSGGWRLQRPGALMLLSIAEIAAAFVLTSGAGLLVESWRRASARDDGFDATSLLTFRIDPVDPEFSTRDAPARIKAILQRVQTLPEVRSASVSMCTPLMGTCGRQHLYFVGGSSDPASARSTGVHYVGADHFATLGMRLLRGRAFTSTDRQGAPKVAVVNATAARRFWPGRDPVGERIVIGDPALLANADSTIEVVGVVNDVTYWPVNEPAGPDVYTPYEQFTYASTYVIARTRIPPRQALPAIRDAIRSVDPDLPLDDIRTMEERGEAVQSGRRFLASVLAAFAGLALSLTVVGVFGVVSCGVSRRQREIGVRLAIGCEPGRVFAMVVREGAIITGAGLGLGVVLALAGTRLLRAALFDVSATDPVVLVVVAGVITIAAMLAAIVPARRATRISPLLSLRAD